MMLMMTMAMRRKKRIRIKGIVTMIWIFTGVDQLSDQGYISIPKLDESGQNVSEKVKLVYSYKWLRQSAATLNKVKQKLGNAALTFFLHFQICTD